MSELAAISKIEEAVSVMRTTIYKVRQKTANYNLSAKLVPATAKNTRKEVNTQNEWHGKNKRIRMTHINIILDYLLQ